MATFKHLFSPFKLGHVALRNRIVSTPHNTHFGSDGYVTQRYVDYYAEKAKGGAGLLQCFGSLGVHPTAPVEKWGDIRNWDDSSLPMFRQFAETMHAHGAAIMAQITHRGRLVGSDRTWQLARLGDFHDRRRLDGPALRG